YRVVVEAVRLLVLIDVGVQQEHLTILDIGIGVFQIRPTIPQGFDFCALQYQACFNRLTDRVIKAGASIDTDNFAATLCHTHTPLELEIAAFCTSEYTLSEALWQERQAPLAGSGPPTA